MFGDKKKLVANRKGIKLIPKTKRESFLPSDKEWLESKPKIEPGEYVGKGGQGAVYTVKDRPSMVVKVPLPYKYSDRTPSERAKYIRQEKDEFLEEWDNYNSLSLEDEPLIIPTKQIKITGDRVKGSFPGLVRPRVKVIGHNAYIPTDEEFEQIRQKLIALSARGLTLRDGLQVGVDRAGRIQLYDLGYIQDRSPKRAAQKNQRTWESFLMYFRKSPSQYGMINPSGRGDDKYLS